MTTDYDKVKATVFDHGDREVGLGSRYWDVECPFWKSEADNDTLEWFRNKLTELYQEFSEGKLTVHYDFETLD
jgi:hypothetical protein